MIEFLKENTWKTAAAIIGVIITVATASITVNSTYARAADVNALVKSQNSQIEYLQKQQTSQLLFQLEYYEDRIKSLEAQRNSNNSAYIDREIADAKAKKEYIRRTITK